MAANDGPPAEPAEDAGPAIWKIDRFAIHDGPGIRTNLYFKGCPLRCLWCCNPEGQRVGRELAFSEVKCNGCGRCFDACTEGALKPQGGRPSIDFGRCNHCGQCALACPADALYTYQRLYTLSQAMDIIKRDRHIYRKSGGGITCSGGEPFLQPRLLKLLLATCQEQGIHTAVESCGYTSTNQLREVVFHVDWLFLDLKHLDGKQHRKLTGRDNAIILNNLRLASSVFAETGKVLAIRQVVVPGVNDGDNIRALAELASGLPRVDFIELLPYHAFGAHKYQTLGRHYVLGGLEAPAESKVLEYKNLIESYGIRCKIGNIY